MNDVQVSAESMHEDACIMHACCRTSRPGECEASEGSLMCEDFLRMGRARMLVDPGVRQAYFPDTARKLYTEQARDQGRYLCMQDWSSLEAVSASHSALLL